MSFSAEFSAFFSAHGWKSSFYRARLLVDRRVKMFLCGFKRGMGFPPGFRGGDFLCGFQFGFDLVRI